MLNANGRLGLLWISQVTRALSDWCLRMFIVLAVAAAGSSARDSAWHLVTAIFIAPFILLAPLNGAISNALPKRWVLVGSSAFCLAVVGVFAALNGLWLGCAALVAVGAAVYSPTRFALLPAAARDTHRSLAQVNGWIEMGSALAIVFGLILGRQLHEHYGTPGVMTATLVLSLFSLLAALPVCFRSDVCRRESPVPAVAGFFHDTLRVLKDRQARVSLLGLASFLALITAGSGALVAYTLGPRFAQDTGALLRAMILVSVGIALGSWLAGLQKHPRRLLGLIPVGATALLLGLTWAALAAHRADAGLGALPVVGHRRRPGECAPAHGLPGRRAGRCPWQRHGGDEHRHLHVYRARGGAPVCPGVWGGARLAAGPTLVPRQPDGSRRCLAWRLLFRASFEQLLELILYPLYRIHGHGPGQEAFPVRGPVLVIANHSAWLDPLWVGKVLPRRITPAMTSMFYDLPVLRWFMVNIIQAVRIEVSTYRREAPELQEAVAVLDHEGCVLFFPEGWLKRRVDQPLRQFGQGVWHIFVNGRTSLWSLAGSRAAGGPAHRTRAARRWSTSAWTGGGASTSRWLSRRCSIPPCSSTSGPRAST